MKTKQQKPKPQAKHSTFWWNDHAPNCPCIACDIEWRQYVLEQREKLTLENYPQPVDKRLKH